MAFSKYLIVVISLLMPTAASFAAEVTEITFSCVPTPNSNQAQYFAKLYGKAFQQLGYRYKQIHMTAQEARKALANGTLDGECGRIGFPAGDSVYSDMLNLPVTVYRAFVSSWSKTPTRIEYIGAEERESLRVGVNRTFYINHLLFSMGFRNIIDNLGTLKGLEQLAAGNLDLWIDGEFAVNQTLDHHKLESLPNFAGSLMNLPVMPVLHPQHKNISGSLTELLSLAVSERGEVDDTTADLPADGDSVPSGNEEALVISCLLPHDSEEFAIMQNFLSRLFAHIGKEVVMVHRPWAREIADLRAERVDGSCARSNIFIRTTQLNNLQRVNSPVAFDSFQVWGSKPSIKRSLEDFKPGDRLATIRGMAVAQHLFADHSELNLQYLTTISSGLKMLSANRIDYLIANEQMVRFSARKLRFNTPLYMNGVLFDAPVYIHLNKKYRDLIPKLELASKEVVSPFLRESDKSSNLIFH